MPDQATRREFLVSTTLAMGALATASVAWPRRLTAIEQLVGAQTRAHGIAAPTPFRMLSVGDSVMWGQGLLENQKFAFKTAAFLRGKLGRDVDIDFFAHSGAKIDTGDGSRETFYGEIGIDRPSILTQLDMAMGRYINARIDSREIGLILLDGGANDFGFKSIADPTIDANWIRRRVQQSCGERMRDSLLPKAIGMFPNAVIVVTGYYQAFSEQSTAIGPAFSIFGFLAPDAPSAKLALLEKGKAFYTETSDQLRAAVAARQAESGNRLVFVDPMFAPENAWGAPQSFIWDVPNVDPASATRINACNALIGDLKLDRLLMSADPTCRAANIMHPNVAGAQRYAEKVADAITPFLGRWSLKRMVVTIGGTPTSDGSQAVTVSARDATTGQPVAGRVAAGVGAGFPTNTATKVAFCRTNTQAGPSMGEAVCATQGLVSAIGYWNEAVTFQVKTITVGDEVKTGASKSRPATGPLKNPKP
ncbi:MAG: ubiquinol-cytochrome c reductase iron-sulfur subunit N-terminal domain-containing protein [Gemmatimonadaceae bacterium]